MLRLINTFKSIIILISKDLFIESMALSRIILEQCAWCYCICSKNEYTDILKINPLDCLKSFKNFYCNAGKVNGFLSKRVHLDVGLVGNYLSINQNEHIITFNPTKDKLDSLYSILQQTDMYCCTIEYTFSQFIDNFKFIDCETTDYRIKDNREFILIANELLDKIYELYDRK